MVGNHGTKPGPWRGNRGLNQVRSAGLLSKRRTQTFVFGLSRSLGNAFGAKPDESGLREVGRSSMDLFFKAFCSKREERKGLGLFSRSGR